MRTAPPIRRTHTEICQTDGCIVILSATGRRVLFRDCVAGWSRCILYFACFFPRLSRISSLPTTDCKGGKGATSPDESVGRSARVYQGRNERDMREAVSTKQKRTISAKVYLAHSP